MNSLFEIWNKESSEPPLKQLARIVEAKQYVNRPLIPPHARLKPVFRDKTANELTQSIISFFTVIDGFCERISSTGRQVNSKGSTIWVYGTGKNGTSDLAACFQGMNIKIEVKTGNDRQSEAQKTYQERIKQAGGIYIIARSFDGFLYEFFKAVEGRLS